MVDWDGGEYELVGDQLIPAARVAIDVAGVRAGERVVDVACGTGNAALLAAELGAVATGVDIAPRLLDVAGARAAERGLDATFVLADAARLPLEDASADAVISVFGVVFAADAQAAAAELVRICAPRGRIVLTSWMLEGPMDAARTVRREAIDAGGAPAGPPPFMWEDRDTLAGALEPDGFSIELREERIAFTGSSPADVVDAFFLKHPLWIADREALEPLGAMPAVRQRTIEIFDAVNEDPDALRFTVGYVVASATRA